MNNFFLDWSQTNDMSDVFPNSGKNKDVMIPVYDMIKSINIWFRKNRNRKKALITRKDIFKTIPEELLENI